MKSLIVVRHAKSSWDLPLEDKKRPLTEGGIDSVKKVGILAQNFIDDDFEIWCSSAQRTSQTATIFCKSIGLNSSRIHFKDSLYTFSEIDLEKIIKNCPNTINKLILFGHNEAITNFVNKFGDETIFNVPTAGLVFIQFETEQWNNINKGKIIKKIFPKEI